MMFGILSNYLKCPNNDFERNKMQKISYALIVKSLMYTQYWKTVKHVMRYLKRIKRYMITCRKSERLEIIRCSNSNFARCQNSKRSTFGYIYILAREAISWKSVKQTLIVLLIVAVEFAGCFKASNHEI
ncbi:hypothetical protein CR513_14953, partial [Mucuna pruriens]